MRSMVKGSFGSAPSIPPPLNLRSMVPLPTSCARREDCYSRAAVYYDSMTLRTQHEKPVYVRLRETIADAIMAGKYSDGDPLPSVRALAAEEQANPLTVAKAYQGFQDEGLIVVKRGVGMFVAPGARARLSDSERNRFLKEEWPQIRARMQRLGIEPAELLDRESA